MSLRRIIGNVEVRYDVTKKPEDIKKLNLLGFWSLDMGKDTTLSFYGNGYFWIIKDKVSIELATTREDIYCFLDDILGYAERNEKDIEKKYYKYPSDQKKDM